MAKSPLTISQGRRGMSLVEILIGLSLAAMLLTAVAAGTNAAFQSLRINEAQLAAVAAARATTSYLTSCLRQASSCAILEVAATTPDGITLSVSELPATKLYIDIPAPTATNPKATRGLHLAIGTYADGGGQFLAISPNVDGTNATTVRVGGISLVGDIQNLDAFNAMTTYDQGVALQNGAILLKTVRIVCRFPRTVNGETIEVPVTTAVGIRRSDPAP